MIGTHKEESVGGGEVKKKSNDKKVVVHVFYTVLGHSLSHHLIKWTGHRKFSSTLCCQRNKKTRELLQITYYFKYILFHFIIKFLEIITLSGTNI